MRIELVVWRDAGGEEGGWKSPADIIDDNPIVHSIGFVAKETENNLTLAMDHCITDGTTNTRSRIPVGMIIKRTVLQEE